MVWISLDYSWCAYRRILYWIRWTARLLSALGKMWQPPKVIHACIELASTRTQLAPLTRVECSAIDDYIEGWWSELSWLLFLILQIWQRFLIPPPCLRISLLMMCIQENSLLNQINCKIDCLRKKVIWQPPPAIHGCIDLASSRNVLIATSKSLSRVECSARDDAKLFRMLKLLSQQLWQSFLILPPGLWISLYSWCAHRQILFSIRWTARLTTLGKIWQPPTAMHGIYNTD